MKFTTLAAIAGCTYKASACIAVLPPSVRRDVAISGNDIEKRDDAPQLETPTNQNNITHWTVEQNTRQMQVSDDAFVARDLAKFNHHADIKVYQSGAVRNLAEHLQDISLVYATMDIHLHNHEYKIIFGEGDWTLAVESVTGMQNGPLTSLDGGYLPPTNKPLDYDLMTIARWNNGWMMEEYLFSHDSLMYRQLGVLPDPPVANLPDLELNPATPLSTTGMNSSSPENKAALTEADDGFNAGNFTLEDLNLSPDAEIYGLTDSPMTPQEYIEWLGGMRKAFPDLRLENKPYRAVVSQGDWTATAAVLSGTNKGELTVLPTYISDKPVPATGKSFEQLHYTIARWQDGKIVGLRINLDLFAMVGSLGIAL